MNRPPMLMHLHFQNDDRRFGLWLPLFLLVPLLLAFLIVLSPLIFVAALILWPTGWVGWAARATKAVLVSLFSLRGLEVDIQNENQCFYIAVK
ncbi:MAG: hypothetical protein A2Z29_09870 [Chloroflexi bacterium RBG_16_56_11]|nr:MAG: hypothetical protein A2Z29_09870 [Chloroflexi bacterium RBG_16_56_11]